ncbi:sensor histidine kinase [Staphylococcus carnosus]|nr:HAMP domain-containing sensor histidine kinase [Staphylococcus carnosus]QPT03451.1 HAMP domain-containing histidine kinase [Staphylococcus carnosus]UQA66174.1 HAMP domain-containing histidine kinase [Staphylococcus carnosus]UTB78988.1 two-component sensor histidine kinase [Staphylococcus carnosus]UTB88541.1 two-component sensor histidine kinase [Staphylococcus carnosus]UTB90889.1 two-component sensor histidine kinase [Staphylococcus carnosus]
MMFSIRTQVIIGVLSSILLASTILGMAYKLMVFNGHTTALLTISAIISSCLALLICSLFLTPLVKRIKVFNRKTKEFANGNYKMEPINFKSPREIKELSHSFNKMAKEITEQMAQIKTEQQEKYELIQNLAHDLKTPLSCIISYSEGLKEGIIAAPKDRDAAYESLIKQSKRLSNMFDELTNVAALELPNKDSIEMIQIDQLLITILSGYEQRMKLDLRNLEVNFCSQLEPFKQYPRPLERILTNLIDNALKFSPTGSPVNLTLSENGERIEISVQDEGIGIQPEHLPRLFERTFRVEHSRNNETGGSGLGLYIANELAKQIGGTINVESTPEVGTKMTVSIPRL